MLPGVHVSDEQDRYREPWAVKFDLGIPNMPVPSIQARDLNTNTFVAAVDQPLLGLARLSQDYASLSSAAEAAQQNVRAVEAGVREEVETGLLRLFEARALADTAVASEIQLDEQLEVMRARLKTGVATNADVLRVDVAVASARQQEIQARAQEQVSRALLLAALGRSQDDASIDFAEPTALEDTARPAPELHVAVEEAVVHRPELAAAQLSAQAAHQRTRARTLALLPDVSLEAAYIHIHGQTLAPEDSAYVGLKASWGVFEWGATFFEQRAADAQAAAAEADEEGTRRRVGTEVSVRLAQLKAAVNAVSVARTAIASAEEAFRVTQELVKAGSATTTDLLDSQSALTQARLNLVRARYEDAIARVALARARGE